MRRKQTCIPGFGFIYQPTYRNGRTGELKHSGVWWMEYSTRDGVVRRSTKQRDQQAAFGELMKLAGARASGQVLDTAPERVRIGQLLDLLLEDYRDKERASLVDVANNVRLHLRPAFGDICVVEMRKADIREFVAKQKRQGYAPATINKQLGNLRRALQLGADEDPPLVTRAIPRWLPSWKRITYAPGS
jgi:hypothetical protein